jgi:hypothetical protein
VEFWFNEKKRKNIDKTRIGGEGKSHALLGKPSSERIHLVGAHVQTIIAPPPQAWVVSLSIGLGSTFGCTTFMSHIGAYK